MAACFWKLRSLKVTRQEALGLWPWTLVLMYACEKCLFPVFRKESRFKCPDLEKKENQKQSLVMPCVCFCGGGGWQLWDSRGVLTLLTELSGCETFQASHTWYNDVILWPCKHFLLFKNFDNHFNAFVLLGLKEESCSFSVVTQDIFMD